jgi:hypothetical protein
VAPAATEVGVAVIVAVGIGAGADPPPPPHAARIAVAAADVARFNGRFSAAVEKSAALAATLRASTSQKLFFEAQA